MNSKYDRHTFGANTYHSGDFYVICDVCGFKIPRSKAKMRWDDALVCPEDWEIQHPQEHLQAGNDRIVPEAEKRPESTDQFRSTDVTQDDL